MISKAQLFKLCFSEIRSIWFSCNYPRKFLSSSFPNNSFLFCFTFLSTWKVKCCKWFCDSPRDGKSPHIRKLNCNLQSSVLLSELLVYYPYGKLSVERSEFVWGSGYISLFRSQKLFLYLSLPVKSTYEKCFMREVDFSIDYMPHIISHLCFVSMPSRILHWSGCLGPILGSPYSNIKILQLFLGFIGIVIGRVCLSIIISES